VEKRSSLKKSIAGRLKLSRMAIQDRSGYQTIMSVSQQGLTYLDKEALVDLYTSVQAIEARQVEGVLVEAGSALGGSAIVMAKAKSPARPFFLYDVFGMIPPPSPRDDEDAHHRYQEIVSGKAQGIRDGSYYGYENDLVRKVEERFERFGLPLGPNHIEIVQGLYEDSLIMNAPVALAHLDCDWYDSVMTCLERIVPYLVPGGVLIIDDYAEWSGCKKAVDDYFAKNRDDFDFEMKSRLHITRKA
jgi:asparagine synthase (glutamine-hydrolysing)